MSESQEWTNRYQKSVMNTFGSPKLVLARGVGAHLIDVDGKEYIDFLGGIAVNALGHADARIVNAVTEQLQTLGHVSNFFATGPQVSLAERLLGLSGADDQGRVFFANSGAEANEAALKLTRRTGRTRIVAAEGSFHGRTMGALALTSKAAYREPFLPLPGEVDFVPYGDAAALRAAVSDQTAAVVLEPIQGEAGVVVPPDGYLADARRISAEVGALLWFDEVQTGIGRTGEWLASTGINPDVITLAKGLGGGIPIGACVAFGAAAALLGPGNHGTTFGGNPVACAAALAVLDAIEADDLLTQVVVRGQQLSIGLGADSRVTQVRGRGLLVGLTLSEPYAAQVVAAALSKGFVLNNTDPSNVRLAPPLNIPEDDVDALIHAWPAILDLAWATSNTESGATP